MNRRWLFKALLLAGIALLYMFKLPAALYAECGGGENYMCCDGLSAPPDSCIYSTLYGQCTNNVGGNCTNVCTSEQYGWPGGDCVYQGGQCVATGSNAVPGSCDWVDDDNSNTTPGTPTPGSINCVSWSNTYINSCQSQTDYDSYAAACITNSNLVTIYLNSAAAQARYVEIDHYRSCDDPTVSYSAWEPVPSSRTRTWALTDGNGEKKVCVQYRNASGTTSNKCDARIRKQTTCTVQGVRKAEMPAGYCTAPGYFTTNCAPAVSQAVTLDTSPPLVSGGAGVRVHSFTVESDTDLTAHVSDLPYYDIGWSGCRNRTSYEGCHIPIDIFWTDPAGGIITTDVFQCPSEQRDFAVPPALPNWLNLYDLWFHYRPFLGNIQVRGKLVPQFTNCTGIDGATDFTGANFDVTIPRLGDGTSTYMYSYSNTELQTRQVIAGSYAEWQNVVIPNFSHSISSITSTDPVFSNYTQEAICWLNGSGTVVSSTNAINPAAWGPDVASTDGTTLSAYVVFSAPNPWTQTVDGDVYALNTITSILPSTGVGTYQYFNKVGQGGYPGVVSYGGLNFGAAADTWVSARGWRVSGPNIVSDNYYTYFSGMIQPPSPDSSGVVNAGDINSIPSDGAMHVFGPYSNTSGDVTLSGNITVGDDRKAVIFIDGNLMLSTYVQVTGSGFIAFIVSGSITVPDTIGRAAPTDVLATNDGVASGVYIEGIYIANGPLTVTSSGNPATERQFVAKGIFIANNFSLNRDLGVSNDSYPSHGFIYDPRLLFTMPLEMQTTQVRWQEVSP